MHTRLSLKKFEENRRHVMSLLNFVDKSEFYQINYEKYFLDFLNIEVILISDFLRIAAARKTLEEKKQVVWCVFYMLNKLRCKLPQLVDVINRKVKEFEKNDLYVGYFVGIKQDKKTLWQDLV